MKEPIEYFYENYGIDFQNIDKIVCGTEYVAVVLKNGNLGVCATLNNYVNVSVQELRFPDLKSFQHRIVLNAYFNAAYNYNNQYDHSIDIFDKINFKKCSKIVMVGYFRSLVDKFISENIDLKIFDKSVEDDKLTDMQEQIREVAKAETLILSSTSIFNNTFLELVKATNDNCKIYLLGPSTLLNKEMFAYRNIKLLFGSVFEPNDINALKIIQQGGGTKKFMPFMTKVFLNNDL